MYHKIFVFASSTEDVEHVVIVHTRCCPAGALHRHCTPPIVDRPGLSLLPSCFPVSNWLLVSSLQVSLAGVILTELLHIEMANVAALIIRPNQAEASQAALPISRPTIWVDPRTATI